MNGQRSALAIVSATMALAVLALSSDAGAYATVAPPPTFSTASGLPDGRVFELASPFDKHGYQAGASEAEQGAVKVGFSVASPDGNGIAYTSSGPAADVTASGLGTTFVAERASGRGWSSRSTTARGLEQNLQLSFATQQANWSEYSPDLSHFVYGQIGRQVPAAPAIGNTNFYAMGGDPFEGPTWLFRSLASPSLEEGTLAHVNLADDELVGMSPDASIVYIAYSRNLLPQDAGRSGWGVYEYRDGAISEAGVLPDGSVPSTGAMPAATATLGTEENGRVLLIGRNNPASMDNQVSEDGKRLFFESSGQLYVHEIKTDGSERSVLVSASTVPGHVGEAAPDGVTLFENRAKNAREGGTGTSAPTYAFASPDGSHVLFQSEDQLTSLAPVGAGLKTYDFDVDTAELTYLPAVSLGGVVTATSDGSSFVFVNDASSPEELDIWTAGPGGGSVTKVAQLPGGGFVGPARFTDGDSVLVFQASAPIPGFNNANSEQIYRYELTSNELGCVSCPPSTVRPSGDAYLSAIDQYEDRLAGNGQENYVVNDSRGVSGDGERVFFGSPDPLVDRDSNGQLDVYEWNKGRVYLISSGSSPRYSLFLDNSVSGGDVFFTTSDELVPGDNDAGFDVYDARIPRAGDNPPPTAVPCSGDVCQGAPSVVQLLGAPPSATFSGAGNIVEEGAVKAGAPRKRTLTRAQKLANALRACRHNRHGARRQACERQARKRSRANKAQATNDGGRNK